MESTRIKLSELEPNAGQVEGLPVNPRQWTKGDVSKLAKSLKETPELFEARPIIVYPHGGKYVILGGNMRYEACRENKDEDAPCVIVAEDTPVQKLKEIVIKDNGTFGAWDYDALANEWDDLPLVDMGVPDIPEFEDEGLKETEKLSVLNYDTPYYQPSEIPSLRLEDCINADKYNAKIDAIEALSLPDETKEVLKMFAYRFLKIDFEAVANYYAFCASEEEKKGIERLRLVLVDGGGLNGFIEDDLLRVASLTDEQIAEIR